MSSVATKFKKNLQKEVDFQIGTASTVMKKSLLGAVLGFRSQTFFSSFIPLCGASLGLFFEKYWGCDVKNLFFDPFEKC